MRYCLLVSLPGVLLTLAGCPKPVNSPPVGEGNQAPPEHQPVTFPLAAGDYPWVQTTEEYEPIVARFAEPEGFTRVALADHSWGQWLRHLPLEPPGAPVLARAGAVILPGDSPLLGAVVDIDVRKDQECADVILRLRAEYLRWAGREHEVVFNLTGEGTISWPQWKQGIRPRLEGDQLKFHHTAQADASRASFESYLDSVFAWCGTLSLAQDGERVAFEGIRVGDFFVHGGSPGHAVLVADLARDGAGHLRALLLQGYMPAQSVHVLAPGARGAWFHLDPARPVDTPIWGAFEWSELKSFRERVN